MSFQVIFSLAINRLIICDGKLLKPWIYQFVFRFVCLLFCCSFLFYCFLFCFLFFYALRPQAIVVIFTRPVSIVYILHWIRRS